MIGVEKWNTKRLDEVGDIFSGSTPSTTNKSFWNGEIVWITPSDLSRLNSPYLLESRKKLTDKGLQSCSAHLLPLGSIVISSRAPIGYVAIPTVNFCTNQGCKSIKLKSSYDSEFTYYNINFHIEKLKNVGEGTTFAEISKTALSKIEIPFPESKQEQTKIAKILSTLDLAIEQTEAIIAKQQRIKTGLMQDLLTKGIDENGNIRSEATHEFKDSPLGRIPVDWDTKPLIDLLVEIGQGWSPDCDTEIADIGDWGVLKTTAVTWDGYQSTENKRLPNTLKPRPKLEVQKGDVLMTRAGPNSRVGVICYVYQTEEKRIFSDKLYKLKPNSSVDGRFLVFSLSGFQSQRYLSALKTGMAESQTNISQEIVKKMLTICPDKIEQIRLSNLLDKICQEGSKNNCVLAKLKKLKTGLMHDLLTGKVRVSDIQNPISTAESLCPPLN